MARRMDPEWSRPGERGERDKEMRVRLRAKPGLTRDKVIESVFSKTEVPFIRIFGDSPNYVALCKEKDAYKLMKGETKVKLNKVGIEVLTPIELKARKSVFVRRLDRHVGSHTREELKEEIEKNHDWVRDVNVVKIKLREK